LGGLVLHLARIRLLLLEVALVGGVDHGGRLEVGEHLHDGVLVEKKQGVIEDLLVVIVALEVIDGRHVELGLALVEEYLMREDLDVLRVDQDVFIGEDQLSLLRLALRRNHRHVVPHDVSIEVLLDEDDLLVKRHQEGLFLYLIYL
jgi:hypothetical protein